jgi:glutathionylspermidine synthase
MIEEIRHKYNSKFTEEKYQAFLDDINITYGHTVNFKIAETPVFITKALKQKLVEACNDIMSVIDKPNFKVLTNDAFFDESTIVPNEDEHSKFIQLDFGICRNDNGELTPKLIELQGFPSLYFFQELLGRKYREHFDDAIPKNFSQHSSGISTEDYIERLRQEIVGDTDPKQVILLEIEPELQATAIDFYATAAQLGIKVLCISDLKKNGKTLSYIDDNGNSVEILKIYNRIIFDELHQRKDLKSEFNFQDEVDVEWIGHPNWFYRISKYTMPLLKGDYVPKSYYLDQLERIPEDLENYVLKPLYSFAGAGVQIHVTKDMITNITEKKNYLLQEKVAYAPVIETMDVPAKCEIRMMLLHNSKTNKTEIVSNLMRLSKGEMVGVKYNKDKTWVGGSTGFFEV